MPGRSSATHQRQAASASRPNARGPRGPIQNTNSVAETPVSNETNFTWERVDAFQCVAYHKYPLGTPEGAYFANQAARLIVQIAEDPLPAKSTLLQETALLLSDSLDDETFTRSVIQPLTIEYGQLKKFSAAKTNEHKSAIMQARGLPEDHVSDVFCSFTFKDKPHAQAPNAGFFAELATTKSLPFTVRLEFLLKIPDYAQLPNGAAWPYDEPPKYIAKLEMCQRTRDFLYDPSMSEREYVTKLTLAHKHPLSGTLVIWSETVNANEALRKDLFDQSKWPLHAPETEDEEDEREDDNEISTPRLTFVTDRDLQLCILKPGKKEDDPSIRTPIADFTIERILECYQFSEDVGSAVGLMKFLVRKLLNREGTGSFYLRTEDEERAPDLGGYKFLDVEVIFSMGDVNTPAQLRTAFLKAHCILACDIYPDQMSNWIAQAKKPRPKNVIVRWGKQPGDNWWVLANAAFKDGMVVDVESSGHAYVPSFFTENAVCPMPKCDFPRIVHIPFAHVRYHIGTEMWTQLMPNFFMNNEIAAKAVFSLAVMGTHADRFWGGEAVGHGFPVGWIYSHEFGSGKTEACLLAHSMLGFFRRKMWAGDATKSVSFEASSLEAGLMKFIDDVVASKGARGPESKAISQLIRAFYDQVSRAVSGKIRQPKSGACFSSNNLINVEDPAEQSRKLTIQFKGLTCFDTPNDPQLYSNYQLYRELISALLPDMVMIGLYEGKLDKHAIMDFVTFLGVALKKERHRSVNEWGKLGFFMCLLNLTFQGSGDSQLAIIEWVLASVSRSVHELTAHSGILDQFVIALLECKEKIAPNLLGSAPDKLLFHHNLRTRNVQPTPLNMPPTDAWWAVNTQQAVHVIKQLTGKDFLEGELQEAVRLSPDVQLGRSYFYNTLENAWPIKKSVCIDEETQKYEDVPLPEDELLAATLHRARCVFIPTTYIDNIRDSLASGPALEFDWKAIEIKSANPEVETYNFYDALVSKMDWFGYRSLKSSTFARFSGALDGLYVGSNTQERMIRADAVIENNDAGFGGDIDAYYTGVKLGEWFSEKVASLDYPPCYAHNPFESTAGNAPDIDLDELESIIEESPPRPKKRARASPTNHAARPRRPDVVDSVESARMELDYQMAVRVRY